MFPPKYGIKAYNCFSCGVVQIFSVFPSIICCLQACWWLSNLFHYISVKCSRYQGTGAIDPPLPFIIHIFPIMFLLSKSFLFHSQKFVVSVYLLHFMDILLSEKNFTLSHPEKIIISSPREHRPPPRCMTISKWKNLSRFNEVSVGPRPIFLFFFRKFQLEVPNLRNPADEQTSINGHENNTS